MKIQTRQLGPLSMRAAVGTVNAEKRTVELLWSTGAPVLRSSWGETYYEQLSMDPAHVRMGRLQNGAPLLADHDARSVAAVLGVVESAKIVNGQGSAVVRFAAAGIDPEADKIFAKVVDGVIRKISVGYRVHKLVKVEGSAAVPTYRAEDWEPHELSVVAIGAEDAAGFRSADQSTNEVQITHRNTNQEHGTMKNRKLQTPDDGNGGGSAPPASPPPVNLDTVRAEAVRLERERTVGIQHACRTAKLGDEFATKLIADGTALDAARALVIDELARRSDETPTDNHVRVTGVEGGDERDKMVRGVSAAIFERLGPSSDVQIAKRRGLAEFKDLEIGGNGNHFRGMSMEHIARLMLDRAGVKHRHIYSRPELIKLAQRASTGDFAILFENVMHKTMRAGYATQEDTWRRWCGVDTVPDFKESHRFMNGAFSGSLPVVPENGEYKNASIPDGSKISISTEKRGEIITLSYEAMVNDDMGALVDVAARFGRKAGKSIEIAAYAMLAENSNLGPTMADTDPFYDDAARANVATSAALSVAAIDADRLKFRAQTFGDDYLDLRPSILLLPVSLESAARIINDSAFDHTTALDGKPNVVKGLFTDIVSSPRLVSATRRFLFTSNKEAFKVVFREGSGEGPTLESEEGFRVDGTQWKARIEFKMNPYDPKTSITNAGT